MSQIDTGHLHQCVPCRVETWPNQKHNSSSSKSKSLQLVFASSPVEAGGRTVLLGSATLGKRALASLSLLAGACGGMVTIASDVPCSLPGLSLLCLSSCWRRCQRCWLCWSIVRDASGNHLPFVQHKKQKAQLTLADWLFLPFFFSHARKHHQST